MTLVERSEELVTLAGGLAGCLAGNGQVTLVSGPVGSGKTELLRTFAQQAVEAGAVFASATASRVEGTLPLGVIGQLFNAARLPAEQTERAARLLEDGALTAMLHEPESESTEHVTAPVLNGLTEILLDASARAPLLIGVDDVHFADPASLHCLLFLVGRIGQSRIMVVLNETIHPQRLRPAFRAELISQRHCRQLRLNLLTRCAVARLFEDRLNLPETHELATACHQVSGGNPMLVNALLQDYRAEGGTGARLVVGEAFGQAVLNCLYRSDLVVRRVARVVAVLGGPATSALIGELLGLDAESTSRAVAAATATGLLQSNQFRHARVRAAVLDCMAPEERAALHERTAWVLHKNGATAVAVARHAIAANRGEASWCVPVLCEAAETALDDDDMALAMDCCRLADRAATDQAERAAVKILLARTQWRLDPSAAGWHVADLLAAARSGPLSGWQGVSLVSYLLWYGRSEEAVDLLDRVSAAVDPDDVETTVAVYSITLRLCYVYPGLFDRFRAGCVEPRLATSDTRWKLDLQVGIIIRAMFTGNLTEDLLVDAEHVLQNVRLSESTLPLGLTCVEALIVADRLDAAGFWCDSLLREAATRRAPVWQALCAAVRGMISFRQGDLAAAEQFARAALNQLSPKSWGVLIGTPLSTLVLATTRTGNYENAVTHLNMRVPEAMFQTRFGLLYLRARGRYYLARGYWQNAIADFDACREMMVRWGLDLPGLAPWRSDMAEAYLGLGQRDRARDLVHDQLARLQPDSSRTRGISLRVLAAAEPQHRTALLQEAVRMLQGSGDQLELAQALADLDSAGCPAGEQRTARLADRRAEHPANQCRTDMVRAAAPREVAGGRAVSPPYPGDEDDRIAELSEAELRVAALAARGHTNRQIAHTLFVTVSTVEQHLTRVYRKLQVSRRTDLPPELLSTLKDTA